MPDDDVEGRLRSALGRAAPEARGAEAPARVEVHPGGVYIGSIEGSGHTIVICNGRSTGRCPREPGCDPGHDPPDGGGAPGPEPPLKRPLNACERAPRCATLESDSPRRAELRNPMRPRRPGCRRPLGTPRPRRIPHLVSRRPARSRIIPECADHVSPFTRAGGLALA